MRKIVRGLITAATLIHLLSTTPVAGVFRDLTLDRAALLMKTGDPIAAAEWCSAAGGRAGLARIATIVAATETFK